ncbi:MAG: hypothetical protein L6R39_001916, partial [Caloplaca ligustica]
MCICTSPAFTDAVAACELTTCSRLEYDQLNQLGAVLCASVGNGSISAILSEADKVLATTSLLIPVTATYPPNVTRIDQASAILATATRVPDLGNPASGAGPGSQVYPPCVQKCVNLTASIITDPNSLAQVCGVEWRLQNAICEVALCNNLERQ